MSDTDMVTGAFGYTGRYLSRRLLRAGRRVRTLTTHLRFTDGLEREVEAYRYTFDDADRLAAAMEGVDTFYNTYWVRYAPGGTTYEQGVANTRALIRAAEQAGVRRIVHVSITKPDHDSFYAYYRGKAQVEDAVRACRLSHAVVRPTVLFGDDDIFVNNIAWLVRHFPVFTVPGDGRYRLRPVAVADLADLMVRLGQDDDDVTTDAVGPETYAFADLVATIADAVGARCRLVHAPPGVVTVILPLIGLVTRDVVLTGDEIRGLMAELIHVDGEATCPTRLSDYLRERGPKIGASYQSELARRRT